MAYSPPPFTEFVWQDAPSTATSLRASNLIADEQNLASYIQSVIIDYDTYARATFATQGSLPGANSAYWLSGLAVSRPSAGAVSAGSFYRASDTSVVSVSDGSSWHLVSTETLGVPIGSIEQYGGSADPVDNDGTSRWLICDGRAISRSTYSNTYTAIGTTYGSGNGTTTFNIPDLRQRFPLGKAASGTGSTLGSTGGSIDHTHNVPGLSVPGLSISDHTHSISNHTHSTPSHSHGLSTNGGAMINMTQPGFNFLGTGDWGPTFNTTIYSALQNGQTSGSIGTINSVGLVGTTNSGGSSTTGSGGSGTTGLGGNGTSGTGTTGTGTSGTSNPSYLVVNFIIRVL